MRDAEKEVRKHTCIGCAYLNETHCLFWNREVNPLELKICTRYSTDSCAEYRLEAEAGRE